MCSYKELLQSTVAYFLPCNKHFPNCILGVDQYSVETALNHNFTLLMLH